jgi:outer membrane immunogenic protein
MIVRRIVGGLALAAGASLTLSAASAADLPPPPMSAPVAPVAYAPAVYNWSGFYIGAHAGGGFANSNWSDPAGGTNTVKSSGFLGGGQVGANIQFNAVVLGVEGDFSWLGMKGSGSDSAGNTINSNVDWTSTVTGRVGVAFDRLLVYGKGGVAFAREQTGFSDVFGNGASDTVTRTGWTAGAGLEYGLTKNWSARVEYDYLGFGSQAMNFSTVAVPAYTPNASLNVQEIKAGLNFRFGGP